MTLLRTLLILAALALPAAASAATVHLHSLTGSVPGFGFSTIHSLDGCPNGGFYMCGSETHAVTQSILTAQQVGSAFHNIHGSVSVDGVQRQVSGDLDFGVAPGAAIGHLTIAGWGTFQFLNLHFSGPANGFSDDKLWLWGQTYDPQLQLEPGEGDWGLDIAFEVTPAMPEPSGALAFGLGALIVRAGTRRLRRS